MHLTQFHFKDFRLFDEIQLMLHKGINTFVGQNASGKSSLLEAVYCLLTTKSFRGHNFKQVVRYDHDQYWLTGLVQYQHYQQRLSLFRQKQQTIVKIDGEKQKTLSDYITTLPCQIIHPESVSLLTGPSRDRRQFLDWSMFHVKHRYVDSIRFYNKALFQRNKLLKTGHTQTLESWTVQLADFGLQIHQQRVGYVEQYLAMFVKNPLLENLPKIDVNYYPGWDIKHSLINILHSGLKTDQERGFTYYGPHRADIRLTSEGQAIKYVFSRGQLKLVYYALVLSQIALNLSYQPDYRSVILIDDLTAELGTDYQHFVLKQIKGYQQQLLLTSLDNSEVIKQYSDRMFHVKHGHITYID